MFVYAGGSRGLTIPNPSRTAPTDTDTGPFEAVTRDASNLLRASLPEREIKDPEKQ